MQNQPPVQVSSQPPAQVGKSSTGLDANVAALLSYIFTWVSGLIFFVMEKESRLVRFHAVQALILGVIALVLSFASWPIWIVIAIISAFLPDILSMLVMGITGLIMFVVFLAIFVGWIVGMVKAYQGEYFKLPVIGNFAEKYSTK